MPGAYSIPRPKLFNSPEPVNRPSVADTVFDELHRQILSVELPPGAKLSEVDVAKAFDVSRQPVRDAFYRLSKLGFLLIRPQRATTVTEISEEAVLQARFVRAALEMQTVQVACETLNADDVAVLDALVEQQRAAVKTKDVTAFHYLDDCFHREICERAGLGFAWEIIRENKAHMDRVRFLSLSFASEEVLDDHVSIAKAIAAKDKAAAAILMQTHLSRIKDQLSRIRADHAQYFTGDPVSDQ